MHEKKQEQCINFCSLEFYLLTLFQIHKYYRIKEYYYTFNIYYFLEIYTSSTLTYTLRICFEGLLIEWPTGVSNKYIMDIYAEERTYEMIGYISNGPSFMLHLLQL